MWAPAGLKVKAQASGCRTRDLCWCWIKTIEWYPVRAVRSRGINGGGLQPVYQTEPLFRHVHDLCVDRQGNIFVVQWNAGGAYPMKLERLR